MQANRNRKREESFRFEDHPWISLIITLLAFVVVLFAAAIALDQTSIPVDAPYRILFQPILPYLIIYFLLVPFGLGLPHGRVPFRQFLEDIRLARIQPLGKLLLLGVSCAFFALLSGSLASLVYRLAQGLPLTPQFLRGLISLRAALPPHSLGFIYTLPCIFEEPMWRGVYLRLFSKHYGKIQASLVTALGFGLLHVLNLIGGGDPRFVLTQVLWGSVMGIFYAYLVFRVDSLLPAMIFHYLVNVFIASFNRYLQNTAPPEMAWVYSVAGACAVVPLLILWVRAYAERWLPASSNKAFEKPAARDLNARQGQGALK